jgi:micrococcal nuclease
MTMQLWTYRATIDRWIDGDTVDVIVDLGFYVLHRARLRLLGSEAGVDAPELNSRDPAERDRARQAVSRAATLAPVGSSVVVQTQRAAAGDPRDGFRRFLARVVLADGTDVGDVLLAEGLAVPYARG